MVFRLLGFWTDAATSGNIGKYDPYEADEIFLSSTAGGIIPVTEVDGRVISHGRPGMVTMELRRKYQQMLREGSHATPVFP